MIAITGASGFLGSYIADRLPFPQKRLSRNARQSSSNSQWIQGNLYNSQNLTEFTLNSPILVHFACTTNPRTSNLNIINDIQQNLISTIQLFEIYISNNPKGHIIFASSSGNMYDANIPDVVHHETDTPFPRSSYSILKLTIEHYLRQFCETNKISATILRISNPYGTLLPANRSQGLIGVAFAKLLAGEELPIFESMDSVRDYIHLEDVLQALKLVIKYPPETGQCRLFHVSSGYGFSTSEVLDLVELTTQSKIKRSFPLNSIPLPTWSVHSYEKINHELGWKPTINLPEGIKKLWENILNNPLYPNI